MCSIVPRTLDAYYHIYSSRERALQADLYIGGKVRLRCINDLATVPVADTGSVVVDDRDLAS